MCDSHYDTRPLRTRTSTDMCRGEKNEIFAGRQPCVFPLALHPSYAWVVIGPSRHLFARPRPRLFAADVPFVATSIAGSSSSFEPKLQSSSQFSIVACQPSVLISCVVAFWSSHDPFTRSSSHCVPLTLFWLGTRVFDARVGTFHLGLLSLPSMLSAVPRTTRMV